MKATSQSFLYILYQSVFFPAVVQSLTHGIDVYDNFGKCEEENVSGPECDIPFELCDDNKHKCFNNSQCKKGSKVDPVTKEPTYRCDCTFAETAESKFAGQECEHSDTVLCKDAKQGQGSLFCTNGGSCMSFIYDAGTRWGCACPTEFVGAHCQYLEASVDEGLVGEGQFPDVHENFWAFIPSKTKKSRGTGIAVGIAFSSIAMITLAFLMALLKRRKSIEKDEIKREEQQQNVKQVNDAELL